MNCRQLFGTAILPLFSGTILASDKILPKTNYINLERAISLFRNDLVFLKPERIKQNKNNLQSQDKHTKFVEYPLAKYKPEIANDYIMVATFKIKANDLVHLEQKMNTDCSEILLAMALQEQPIISSSFKNLVNKIRSKLGQECKFIEYKGYLIGINNKNDSLLCVITEDIEYVYNLNKLIEVNTRIGYVGFDNSIVAYGKIEDSNNV